MKLVAFPGGESQKVELLNEIQHGIPSVARGAVNVVDLTTFNVVSARTLNETDCERYGISYDLLQLIFQKSKNREIQSYLKGSFGDNASTEDLINAIPVGADTSKIRYNLILLLWSRLTGKNPIVPYEEFKEFLNIVLSGVCDYVTQELLDAGAGIPLMNSEIKSLIDATKQQLTSFQEYEHCLNLISKPLNDLRKFQTSTDVDFDIPMAQLRALLPTFYAINDKELHTAMMIMNAAISPSSMMAFQLRNHFTGLDLLEIIKGSKWNMDIINNVGARYES